MFRPKIGLATASILTLVLAQAANADEKLKVVTTFTVLADMAQNVAGDAAEVVSITKPGAEIHGYEPTPRDIVGAHDADLILWNGLNLELWFEQFLRNLGDLPSATLSEGIDPIAIAQGAYEGKANPHAWMGLDNAQVYVDNIAAALSETLLIEEGAIFFWVTDINPTLKIYIPSPWMGFVIINLFIAWLFYRAAIRRVSRREKQ